MDYETLVCETRTPIAIVTLNRPEKRNALSRTLREELPACLASLAESGDILAVVLTGAGKSFCAGFDLEEFQTGDAQDIFSHATRYHHQVYHSPLPLVAAVNGHAMAGGMDLAAMCDIRLASGKALFGQPQVRMGIAAAFDLLRTVLPESLARELCLTGRTMNADEAMRHGFVSEIPEDHHLLDRAVEVAETIAGSRASAAMKKRFIELQPDLFEDQ